MRSRPRRTRKVNDGSRLPYKPTVPIIEKPGSIGKTGCFVISFLCLFFSAFLCFTVYMGLSSLESDRGRLDRIIELLKERDEH